MFEGVFGRVFRTVFRVFFQRHLRVSHSFLRLFQGCFGDVSSKSKDCFKGVLRVFHGMFQGCFKVV